MSWEFSGVWSLCFWHLLPAKTVRRVLSCKAEKVVKQADGERSHATRRSYVMVLSIQSAAARD